MRDNWQEYKLSDLAKFRRGSFPQPYGLDKWYDDENGHPFIQVYDVSDNMRLKETTKRRISNAAAEQSVFIPKGTIILTIQGSIGRIAITHYDAYMDRTLLVFQSFLKPTDKRYFMYVVHRLFEVEKEKAHGSTIKTITKEQLSSFTIPFPPLPEQQKIAEILSTVDAKIEIIDQQISETQELKKGLMQQLLSKGIGHTEFKDSALGKIPKSWEVLELVKHIKLLSGFAFKSNGFNEEGKGVKLLRGINITIGKLRWNDKIDRWWDLPFDDFDKYSAQTGDLVISMDGSLVGRNYARVKEEDLPLLLVQRVACLRANKTLYLEFLNQIIGSPLWLNYVDAVKTSSGIPHISAKNIREFKIPFPSFEEQNQIAEILSSVDDKLQVLSEKKTTYKELKQGLMQQLLTGKVRV
jgi:type I restriction enzyme S subunit